MPEQPEPCRYCGAQIGRVEELLRRAAKVVETSPETPIFAAELLAQADELAALTKPPALPNSEVERRREELHRAYTDAGRVPPPLPNKGKEAKRLLGYRNMGSGGRCDWTHLREAVAEANMGYRSCATPFDEGFYPGHQMVEGVNYNSLDRIVTAFVDAALSSLPVRSGEEIFRAGWTAAVAFVNKPNKTGLPEEVDTAIGDAFAALATPQQVHGAWFCHTCQAEVHPEAVTNDERHELCGTALTPTEGSGS